MRSFTPLLTVLAIGAALVSAPVAAAAPECTNVAPNTTQCETNGSAQISADSPSAIHRPRPAQSRGR